MLGNETEHNDDRDRERIVFGQTIDWEDNRGGLEYIGSLSDYMDSGIGTETLSLLIEEGYVDPEETQNRGPEMQELLAFGNYVFTVTDHVMVEYSGYMIDPERPDSRITITSITIESDDGHAISQDVQDRFINEFRRADEFQVGDDICNAWWD